MLRTLLRGNYIMDYWDEDSFQSKTVSTPKQGTLILP
jgi:hypothetical protein